MLFRLLALAAAMALPLSAAPETPDEIARQILAPLLDPVKVAMLQGDQPVNTRLYKVLYWLETARERGGDAVKVRLAPHRRRRATRGHHVPRRTHWRSRETGRSWKPSDVSRLMAPPCVRLRTGRFRSDSGYCQRNAINPPQTVKNRLKKPLNINDTRDCFIFSKPIYP
jgi:hypothetical protein